MLEPADFNELVDRVYAAYGTVFTRDQIVNALVKEEENEAGSNRTSLDLMRETAIPDLGPRW